MKEVHNYRKELLVLLVDLFGVLDYAFLDLLEELNEKIIVERECFEQNRVECHT